MRIKIYLRNGQFITTDVPQKNIEGIAHEIQQTDNYISSEQYLIRKDDITHIEVVK